MLNKLAFYLLIAESVFVLLILYALACDAFVHSIKGAYTATVAIQCHFTAWCNQWTRNQA